jgi:primary-amine oxidase
MTLTPAHPLDALTADEVRRAVEVIRADARYEDDTVFVHVRLHEPAKDVVLGHEPGAPVTRELEALLVPPARLEAIEVVASVTDGTISSWTAHADMRPALLFGESMMAIIGVKAHPDWQAALRRRGIEDFDLVQIDPWPAGSFGVAHEEGRRISRCISYVREAATDNGYARPIEGVIAFFDQGAGEVLEVVDLGVVPMPTDGGSYLPADVGPMRTDLKPLDIVQPEGASFVVDGNHVRWSRWSFRLTFDPYEGLVLHTVQYHDADRVRPVLHRASISEMVVPYGDPGPMHGWKNAFDAGEWGLGRMGNSLKHGCDCLGVIHYFDAVLSTEQGDPYTVENAVCLHEEDYGILWKHNDLQGGTNETRRSRRLVVSFIATVGNYEYGFYWYFYLDGNIQLEVKLTGIVSPMAITPGEQPEFANLIAPGLAAPHHQHLFSARLDLDVDGAVNSVYEVEAEPVDAGPANPWGNWAPSATPTRPPAARGGSPTNRAATGSVSRWATSSCPPCRRPRCWRRPSRASVGAPDSPGTTCGSRPTGRTNVVPPASTRTSMRAATVCRAGPRPTGHSSRPTSCSGTRSGSRTSCARRIGRSCRWSTPASCSPPSASSTAIPRSTWPRPAATAAATRSPRRRTRSHSFEESPWTRKISVGRRTR